MLSVKIDEPKHKLNDVIKKQGASATTVHLFETFLNEVKSSLERQGKKVKFRSHIYGVTAFCSEHKAFMFVNVRKNFVSTLYFTGKKKIPGLAKKNWLTGTDPRIRRFDQGLAYRSHKPQVSQEAIEWQLKSYAKFQPTYPLSKYLQTFFGSFLTPRQASQNAISTGSASQLCFGGA